MSLFKSFLGWVITLGLSLGTILTIIIAYNDPLDFLYICLGGLIASLWMVYIVSIKVPKKIDSYQIHLDTIDK